MEPGYVYLSDPYTLGTPEQEKKWTRWKMAHGPIEIKDFKMDDPIPVDETTRFFLQTANELPMALEELKLQENIINLQFDLIKMQNAMIEGLKAAAIFRGDNDNKS